jgi:hypothetical protein
MNDILDILDNFESVDFIDGLNFTGVSDDDNIN